MTKFELTIANCLVELLSIQIMEVKVKNKIIAIQTLIILLFLFSNVESYSNNKLIRITVGRKDFVVVDGDNKVTNYEFDVAPRIVNNKMLVQASKVFNNKVITGASIRQYDNETKTATIMVDEPEVFFNGAEKDLMIKIIHEAKKSIDIAMYRIQEEDAINSIVEASKKKSLTIRMILNKDKFNCDYISLIEKEYDIEGGNFKIKWKNTGAIMHRKLMVVDGKTITLGSTNWTDNALKNKNWEITLISNNIDIAKKITEQFDKEWESNEYTEDKYCE